MFVTKAGRPRSAWLYGETGLADGPEFRGPMQNPDCSQLLLSLRNLCHP